MLKSFKFLFVLVCSLIGIPEFLAGQTVSNAGTEFWIAFPSHVPDFDKQFNISYANISIFLTGLKASSGVVSAGKFNQRFTVVPGTVTEIDIPRSEAYINEAESGTILHNRAIHIVVDPGGPKIVTYAHIFAGQRSEASLILPKEGLGQQYFSVNYKEHSQEGKNYITLVGTEPETRVHFMRGSTELVPGGVMLEKVNDVYEYLSADDLTGVSVTVDAATSGCKHFAVFTGSTAVYIPTANCVPNSIDPLFQQCYPIENWGNRYVAIPFSNKSPSFNTPVRTAGQFIRILAKDDATNVKINGSTVATLNKGTYFQPSAPITKPVIIYADKPVCVAQYALTQSCSDEATSSSGETGYSDPDMVILNPIDYNIKDITLYSSVKEKITEQYVNIVIKTSAAASLTINGKLPLGQFKTVDSSSGLSYIQILLQDSTNTFHIKANDGFNAIAYGFGNVESYSYSAGTDLAANGSIEAISSLTNLIIDSACVNEDYHFELTLPYITSQISWQLDKNELPVVQNNPIYKKTIVAGKIAYIYKFPKTKAYNLSGNHLIKILSVNSVTLGGCINEEQETDGTFRVVSPPIVRISASKPGCNNEVTFKNDSTGSSDHIIGYLWNFNDVHTSISTNSSTLKEPVHIFTDSGRFIIKLTLFSSTGCQSIGYDTIIISRQIKPDFNIGNGHCVGKPIIFSNISKTSGFKVVKYTWNFGDGETISESSGQVSHIYKKSGTYFSSLILTSDNNCISDSVIKRVILTQIPTTDFTFPSTCVNDEFVQFILKPVNAIDSLIGYHYSWKFGDNITSVENPNTSKIRNPKHRYALANVYTVTVTITSPEGCDTTIQKKIQVNGGNPIADFELDGSEFCNSHPIILTDRSKLDGFGAITKLEWYFDLLNQPEAKETINLPTPGQKYIHTYPVFYQPASGRSYKIKLIAYSGISCKDSLIKTINVSPAAEIRFDSLKQVCNDMPSFRLTAAQVTNGVVGNGGSYSGDGVSFNDTFNPSSAGIGIHNIKYKFISASGCADSATMSINVLSTPKIKLKQTIIVANGTSVKIKAFDDEPGLTYKWTPENGLDNASVAQPIAAIQKNTEYKVVVSNGDCTSTGIVELIVISPPNAFTPNGDGVNDYWSIPELSSNDNAQVKIFTRDGVLVFHSLGYTKPWDGKYNGKNVPAGVYYYVISLNNSPASSGYITLLR